MSPLPKKSKFGALNFFSAATCPPNLRTKSPPLATVVYCRLLTAGVGEKFGTSKAATSGSASSSQRTLKSAELTSGSAERRRQSCNGPSAGRRHRDTDTRVNSASSVRSGQTTDDDSNYYSQRVAPLLDEMAGCVGGKSSSGMIFSHLCEMSTLQEFL